MELRKGKIIDLLTKLKYREVEPNTISTTNGIFTIFIVFDEVANLTEVTVYENYSKPNNYNTVLYENIDGNLLSEFTVISNEDYLINKLEVEI